MMNYVAEMEMRRTVSMGDITTRDETDYGIDSLQQSRFVSTLACGAQLEMNTVINNKFVECSAEYANGGPIGMLTADFVDCDELYPYRPRERVRQDITVVATVQSHTRKKFDAVAKEEMEETVVTLARTCFVKVSRSESALPHSVEHTLRQQIGHWGHAIVRSVVNQVYSH